MIILMGLAGSGKSTQGNALAEGLGGVWLSVGQILRDSDNAEVHAIQQAGGLVPDQITIPLIADKLTQLAAEGKTAVVDGYPRTVEQAEWVADHLAKNIEVVIWLAVPKTELLERLRLRARVDDEKEEVILERFRLIEQNIYSICEVLRRKGVKITQVDGTGAPETVTARLYEVLNKVWSGEPLEEFTIKEGENG